MLKGEAKKAALKRWRTKNKDKTKAAIVRYREAHPEWYLNYKKIYHLRRVAVQLGTTLEHIQSLPDECEICKSTKKLHIDHDHSTMKVRGKLCSACNTSIGQFRDDPALLRKAAMYVLKYRKRHAQ